MVERELREAALAALDHIAAGPEGHRVHQRLKRALERSMPVTGDAVEQLAERFEAMHAKGDKWISCVAASSLVRSHFAAIDTGSDPT